MRRWRDEPVAGYTAARLVTAFRFPAVDFDVLSNLLPVAYQLLDDHQWFNQVWVLFNSWVWPAHATACARGRVGCVLYLAAHVR